MSDLKVYRDKSVLTAARERIAFIFDSFPKIYVSFSAGKDSSVMLHLAMKEARRRNRKVAVLLIDLEAQYSATIEHAERMYAEYAEWIEPYWIALPLALRNAVSMFQPQWRCWDPEQRSKWVRTPPGFAITDGSIFPFFRAGMEFEEFVEHFGDWYGQGELTACLVGIRADESLNRFRTIFNDSKSMFDRVQWTTYKGTTVYNAYPIYDWRTEDVWTYNAITGASYNRIYDLMHKAGLSIHQMRICQPYGDDQRKGLWLFHVLEPETWVKVVNRVADANSGALYADETGPMMGVRRIYKPEGMTWQQFARFLLASMPPQSREHYENKIAVFLHWWEEKRGYRDGIPDEADRKIESERKAPTWRRICKVLLSNDWWCKGLSFSQGKSDAYEKYLKVMKARKAKWSGSWYSEIVTSDSTLLSDHSSAAGRSSRNSADRSGTKTRKSGTSRLLGMP
jgi:predicted phosphoadenosine phosphosulfate sulfurtransferase